MIFLVVETEGMGYPRYNSLKQNGNAIPHG